MRRRISWQFVLLTVFLFVFTLAFVTAQRRSVVSYNVSPGAGPPVLEDPAAEAAQIELDTYGGLLRVPSPKGKSAYWRVEKFGSRWMFVTPEGHAFWSLGVFAVQPAGNPDAKYGSMDNWGVAQMNRLVDWGFDTLAEYAHPRVAPENLPRTGRRMPTFAIIKFSQNVVTNRLTIKDQQPAPDAVKNLIECQDLHRGYTGWRSELPDVFDPNFDIFVNNTMAALKADVYGEGAMLSSKWIIGLTTDDTDYLFGSGAGLDLPVGDGTIHPHIGWLSLAATPTLVSSANYGITYKNPTVYSKAQLIEFLHKKYAGNIAALNAAWGSNYATFDSDGGYGTGKGLTDENGSHTGWLGNRDGDLRGAKPGVVKDLDEFLYLWMSQYYRTTTSRMRQYARGFLIFSPVASNWHGGIPRKQVLQAAAENCDVLNVMLWTQQVLDLTAAAVGDKPMIPWEGIVANPDSALFDSPNPGLSGIGVFNTQSARGTFYGQRISFLVNATVKATGNQPVVGIKFWAWPDHSGEHINWGLVTPRDNAYDGKEAVRTPGKNRWGFRAGGEDRDYGDFISAVKAGNHAALLIICQQLGDCHSSTPQKENHSPRR